MKPLIVGDSFSPPRPVWDFVVGIWQISSLKQVSSDIAAARALFKPLVKRDVEFEAEAMPTLVDEAPRLLGLLVREFTALTHYMLGAFYTKTSTRLRIYKQYSGLPKVQEGLATATLDECFADSCLVDTFATTSVRGLSPRYTVVVTYYDGSSESFTVPLEATSISFAVKKPIKRIDVYDVAKRLQGSNTQLSGGLDDFFLGGPQTIVLLSDAPLTWDFSRARLWARVRANVVEVGFAGQYTYAIDTEFSSPGYHGLRAYQAPSEWYAYRLRRWG
jgi:uncharacterized protein YqgV (UPF0045/DUF77 family)